MEDHDKASGYTDILLLDDSELNNLLNTQFLHFTMPNAKITAYEDGSLLLELLLNGAVPCPDLILLDVNMPELNGWEFLEQLDKHKIDTDVIMLSSSRHLHDIKKSEDYPRVQGYIEKPLTEDKIEEYIVGYHTQ